jgi:hypothetical protein
VGSSGIGSTAGCGIAGALASENPPNHIVAVLEALQFSTPSTHRLDHLVEKEWLQLLDWCDTRQLTLSLPNCCGPSLPADVRANILEKSKRYAIRFERLKSNLFEITGALHAAQLDFVLLKGLSHAPVMTPNALLRAQGDIDLWLRGPNVYKAQEVLQTLGYAFAAGSRSRHLGPMARPNNWRWRGDLFDPEMPISIELHYELWSSEAECIEVPQLEQFWARKIVRDFDGHKIHVLCDQDLLGFAALHLLLHLVHGDLPLQRAWEIARFLDIHTADERFWETWRITHCAELRRLETSIYYLVSRWFSCRLPQSVSDYAVNMTNGLRYWLDKFYLSPLSGQWRPNKREVWLHLALINNRRNKFKVLFRRLFPRTLPQTQQGVTSPALLVRHLQLITSRLARHVSTLIPTIFDGVRLLVLRRL